MIVVGNDEMSGQKFKVNDRFKNCVHEMDKQQLEQFIKQQIKSYPYRPLAVSKQVSKRPSFYGAI